MPNDHSPLPWRMGRIGGRCSIAHKHGRGKCTYAPEWFGTNEISTEAGELVVGMFDYDDGGVRTEADAEYIVRAANAYPLAEEMAQALSELEWFNETPTHWGECPRCGYSPVDGGHTPDCELARLLQAARDAGLLGDQPDRRAEA